MLNPHIRKHFKIHIVILDVIVICFALSVQGLTSFMFTALPACPFAQNGIMCPSCGGTRCVRSFFTGEFVASFFAHPYVFFLILYVILLGIILNAYCLLNIQSLEKAIKFMCHYKTIISLAVGYALFGLLRIVIF